MGACRGYGPAGWTGKLRERNDDDEHRPSDRPPERAAQPPQARLGRMCATSSCSHQPEPARGILEEGAWVQDPVTDSRSMAQEKVMAQQWIGQNAPSGGAFTETGLDLVDGLLGDRGPGIGASYRRPAAGESIELYSGR